MSLQSPVKRPLVMGIVNVTPDSFSDGGRLTTLEAALEHALRLIAQGADVLDIGGESTRPGSDPVGEDDEAARTLPLIAALRAHWDGPISIDTMKRAPKTMQDDPCYDDVVAEVTAHLAARAEAAVAAGVARDRIWLDPGLGFAKKTAHNLTLTARLEALVALGFPILYAASRKRMIQGVDATALDAADRLGGSLALALEAARRGARMVRVHDVRETVQALQLQAAVEGAAGN